MPIIPCDLQERVKKDVEMSISNDKQMLALAVNSVFPITPKLKKIFFDITEDLKKAYPKNFVVPESVFMKELKKHIPKDEDRIKAKEIFLLQYLLDERPELIKYFKWLKESNELSIHENRDTASILNARGTWETAVDDLPLSKVRVLLSAVLGMTTAPERGKFYNALIGPIQVAFRPTAYMRQFDNTGSLAVMVEASKEYSSDIQSEIKAFTNADTFKLAGDRNYGTDDVYKDLLYSIKTNMNIEGTMEEQFKIYSMFHWLNHGRAYIEDGKFMIYADYGIVYKTNKAGRKIPDTYKDTNDVVVEYQNPMTIEEYLNGKGLNKIQKSALKNKEEIDDNVQYRIEAKNKYLKLDKESLDIMKNSVPKIQQVYKEFIEYLSRTNELADREILTEIRKIFKKSTKKSINKAIYREKLDDIHPEEKKDMELILEIFRHGIVQKSISLFGPLSSKSIKPKSKSGNYAPTIYPDIQFILIQISKAINKAREWIKAIKSADYLTTKEKKSRILGIEASIEHFKEVREDKVSQEFSELLYSGEMSTPNTYVHLKSITGIFDIRDGREDPGVPGTYFRRNITVVKKKILVAKTLEAIRLARRKKSKLMQDYILDIYTQMFNRPDTGSGIPGIYNSSFMNWWDGGKSSTFATALMPFPLAVGKIAKKAGVGPEVVFRFFKMLQKIPTFALLWSPADGFVNMSANIYKGLRFGISEQNRLISAFDEMPETEKEIAMDIIQSSGVLEFNEFFVESLVEDFENNLGLGIEDSMYILKETIKMWKAVDGGLDIKTAADSLYNKIGNNAQIISTIDKTLAERMLKEVKLRDRERSIARLVNAAITRVFPAIDKINSKYPKTWYQDILSGIRNKAWSISETILSIDFMKKYSMGETESKLIRIPTAKFALMKFLEIGKFKVSTGDGEFRNKRFDEFTEADKLESRHLIRESISTFDYEMSPTDLGPYFRGALGGLQGKFGGWRIQHLFMTDITLLRNMIASLTNMTTDYGKRGNALKKTIQAIIMGLNALINAITKKKSLKQFRKENPDAYTFLNYYLTTGFFSALLVLEPSLNLWRYIFRNSVVGKFGYQTMGALSNNLINFAVIMPLVLLSMAARGWDDDEIDGFMLYKLRHIPAIGFFISLNVMLYMTLWGAMFNDDEMFEKASKNLRGLIIPDGVYNIVKDLLDD